MSNGPRKSPQASYRDQPLAQPVQQPQKKSRRTLWTILVLVGTIVVLSCLACASATAMGVGPLAQAIGPVVAADQYYQAIQSQDYTQAYSFLAPNAVLAVQNQTVTITSIQTFSSAAQALDQQFGKATTHTVRATGLDTSHLMVIVNREGEQYDVTLTMVQIGNDWKIKTMDGI